PPSSSHQLRLAEEESDLDLRVLVRVRSVDRVLLDRLAELRADGTLVRLLRIGRAHDLPQVRHGVVALERGDIDGPGSHVLDERRKERPLAMHCVKALGLFASQADFFQAQDAKALGFEAADDFAEITLADGVRLDDREGAVRHSGADYSQPSRNRRAI